MKITFKRISIENFKGIEKLVTELGNKTMVYGGNETGKTTFADAISYVLTGKNSLGESTFQILPKDAVNVSPRVDLDVEIERENEKKTATLTRMYKAKINKDKEFTREYQTVCMINGIETGPKDFDRWISDNICYSELFRLLHDTRYFTENIATTGKEKKWEIQRRMLFAVCGIPNDSKLVESEKRFFDLRDALSRYSDIREYLSYLKAKEKETNDFLSKANIKIELLEGEKSTEFNFDKIRAEKKRIEDKLQSILSALEKERKDYEEGKREEKEDIGNEIQKLRDDYNSAMNYYKSLQEEYMDKAKGAYDKKSELNKKIFSYTAIINKGMLDLKQYENVRDGADKVCPVCGQALPSDKIEAEKKKAINSIEKEKNKIKQAKSKIKELKTEIEKIEGWLATAEPAYPDEVNSILEKIKYLQKRMDDIRAYPKNNHEEEILGLKDSIRDLNEILLEEERDKEISDKISAIDEEIQSKLDERANLNRLSDLCRDFLEFKCKYAEQKINSMFGGIEFKMFKFNKTNGEYRDCCDIFWHGVHYDSLSYSTKFVVGIKIALVFQRLKNIQMPIVIDNTESIDLGAECDVQTIFLIKREEKCPKCGCYSGRKESDGMWKCKYCGEKFKKSLEIIAG